MPIPQGKKRKKKEGKQGNKGRRNTRKNHMGSKHRGEVQRKNKLQLRE
jgi:hypothetical protein